MRKDRAKESAPAIDTSATAPESVHESLLDSVVSAASTASQELSDFTVAIPPASRAKVVREPEFEHVPSRTTATGATAAPLFAPHWPTLRRDAAARVRATGPRRVTPVLLNRAPVLSAPWATSTQRTEHVDSTQWRDAAKHPAHSPVVAAELRRIRQVFVVGMVALALAATALIGVVVTKSVTAAVAPAVQPQ